MKSEQWDEIAGIEIAEEVLQDEWDAAVERIKPMAETSAALAALSHWTRGAVRNPDLILDLQWGIDREAALLHNIRRDLEDLEKRAEAVKKIAETSEST